MKTQTAIIVLATATLFLSCTKTSQAPDSGSSIRFTQKQSDAGTDSAKLVTGILDELRNRMADGKPVIDIVTAGRKVPIDIHTQSGHHILGWIEHDFSHGHIYITGGGGFGGLTGGLINIFWKLWPNVQVPHTFSDFNEAVNNSGPYNEGFENYYDARVKIDDGAEMTFRSAGIKPSDVMFPLMEAVASSR